jgi:DNA-binding HxlR family transcriptional regulator
LQVVTYIAYNNIKYCNTEYQTIMKKNISEITSCPIRNTIELIGGKWTFSIIYILLNEGTQRFKELERKIEGINTRMLVKELKTLEQNGIISRKVYPQIPPKVEYSLTEKGLALKSILNEIKSWGTRFLELNRNDMKT